MKESQLVDLSSRPPVYELTIRRDEPRSHIERHPPRNVGRVAVTRSSSRLCDVGLSEGEAEEEEKKGEEEERDGHVSAARRVRN